MKKWVRWQDWVTFCVGLVLIVTPFVTSGMSQAAQISLVLLGVLLAGSSLWSLAVPGSIISEWAHAVLGLLTFIAPWAVGYTNLSGPAWTSWIMGVIACVAGLWAVPASQQAHRQLAERH